MPVRRASANAEGAKGEHEANAAATRHSSVRGANAKRARREPQAHSARAKAVCRPESVPRSHVASPWFVRHASIARTTNGRGSNRQTTERRREHAAPLFPLGARPSLVRSKPVFRPSGARGRAVAPRPPPVNRPYLARRSPVCCPSEARVKSVICPPFSLSGRNERQRMESAQSAAPRKLIAKRPSPCPDVDALSSTIPRKKAGGPKTARRHGGSARPRMQSATQSRAAVCHRPYIETTVTVTGEEV